MHSDFVVIFPSGAGAEYLLSLAPNLTTSIRTRQARVYKIPYLLFGSCGYLTSFDSCACLLTSEFFNCVSLLRVELWNY